MTDPSAYRNDIHSTSLREVFVVVGDYFKLFRRRWLWLAALFVLGALLGWVLSRNDEPVYKADLTFLISEESSGGIGSLLGQIGFGGGGAESNYDKITTLAQSQKIANAVLLDTLEIAGVTDLIANHIIHYGRLRDEWKLPADRKIEYEQDGLTPESRSLLRQVHNWAYGNPRNFVSVKANDDTGILTLQARSVSQDLAYHGAHLTYKALSTFYTNESIGNKRASVIKLKAKVDSLRSVLSAIESEQARLRDTRLGVLQQRDRIRETQLQRELTVVGLAYGEVVKNHQTADFALSTATPYFQALDLPYTPLPKDESEPWLAALIGGVALMGIGALLFAGVYFYQQVMSKA